ncbi:MAG TPA: DHA2 family efflux MFS transporter permease subunit [Desulfosporosinus sp.]|nr:DHA2 family efflux MFS transporter permease subunit [Desulfosporosinus sp.]
MSEHDERYMWLSLLVVVVGTFMSILDSSIVNVALPKMMSVFSASTQQISWVLTGYMLTMGIVIPLTGYLGDTFGYKKIYIFALTVFTFGSALCGFSWSTNSLVVARVIQGIGGGMIIPVGMAMIFQIVPVAKRGMALGIWGIAAMAAPAIGPTLSGFIVEYLDWRLIFTLNIPVGILGVTLAFFILRETTLIPNKRFDLGGALTVAIGLFSLLYGLSKVSADGWNSATVIGLLIMAVIFLTTFVIIELNHSDPLMDLRILKYFPFTLSLLISVITTFAMFGGVFLVPLYMQNLRGLTAMQTGLIMFPSAIATGIMMPISGRLFDRYGAKWLTISGLSIIIVSTYALSRLGVDTSTDYIKYVLIIRGIGIGLCMMPTQTSGMNAIPIHLTGRASALSSTIRQAVGAMGIAIISTIVQSRMTFHEVRYAENFSTTNPQVMQTVKGLTGMPVSKGLSPLQANYTAVMQLYGQVMKQAMVTAMDDTFLILAIITCLGIPLGMLVKNGQAIRPKPVPKTVAVEH